MRELRRPSETLTAQHAPGQAKEGDRVDIDLVVTKGPDAQLSGTVCWSGLPQPVPFNGVLELMALLEEAAVPDGSRRDGTDR
jgi:hypothetical protein